MQAASVVTWPQPMDGSIYPPVGNPCTYLLENALCYIMSGLMLLVVGVIITSLTFQNLEDYKEEQINRYAGPVLIGAGILVIARGALSHLCPQRSQFARQRSLLRRYVRELYTRPIFGMRNDSTDLCDIHVSDSQDISGIQECPRPARPNPPLFLSAPYSPGPPSYTSRLRMYSDDPPPYDVVISQEYFVTNPVPDIVNQVEANAEEDVFQNVNEGCVEAPPPSYEEFMRTSRL